MADETYYTSGTSGASANMEDRVLSEGATTRKVLRATIHDNPSDPDATIDIVLIHQRKRQDDTWEDEEGPPLNTLKAGESARFALCSADTLKLRKELEALYEIYEQRGVPRGKQRLVVIPEEQAIRTDRHRAIAIRELLEREDSEDLWTEILSHAPDFATRLCQMAIQRQREIGLRQFEQMLEAEHPEEDWQDFLDANTWIFGYGLNYQVQRTVQVQPNYGGAGVDHRGGRRGDYLQSTEGDVRFTVLLEIKTPQTKLLRKEKYRNGAFGVSKHLAGAISQVQTNCHAWQTEGSMTRRNDEIVGGVLTVQPKGILVIGRTLQLGSYDEKVAFELLRRNMIDPDIMTFDELLARARFIVAGHGGG